MEDLMGQFVSESSVRFTAASDDACRNILQFLTLIIKKSNVYFSREVCFAENTHQFHFNNYFEARH